MQSFKISVDESQLTDLRDRLVDTRWPDALDDPDWSYGTDRDDLQSLGAYWLEGYDWRAHERTINAFGHFRAEIDRWPVHFVNRRGTGPAPMPLIISHGWPWTFWEWRKVIAALSDPAAHGGDPADAFDIVVSSLAGFDFSTPLAASEVNFVATADLWVKLMRDEIGYPRFAAQGGDFGAMVMAQMGHGDPALLHGIHLHFMLPLDGSRAGGAGQPGPENYAPDQAGSLEANQDFLRTRAAYSAVQRTWPQTIAYALNDPPVGLLAWMIEKRQSSSDNDGDIENCFSRDDLITSAMLYWLTESAWTAARYYAEAARRPWQPTHKEMPVVGAPMAALVFPREVIKMPRAWVKRYFNLQRWTQAEHGGHFAPMEPPDALVEHIRAFFRLLRAAAGHAGEC